MPRCPTCQTEVPPATTVCPNDGTAIPPGLEGLVLGERYRVIRELGEGGMGRVYLAEHVILGKQVAVKVLRAEYSRLPDLVKRFQLEAVAASQIGQENIVDVNDFGQTPDGSFYFVMEYVTGRSLAQLIDGGGPLKFGRALPLLLQISKALGAAHSRGIVHRDLKPDNVLVTRKADGSEIAKVLDFGISKVGDGPGPGNARITQVGMVVGTPHYMAPEQATGGAVDLRVDIYAFGVLGYELLVGKVPFDGESSLDILIKHQKELPVPMRELAPDVEIPERLEALLMQCLKKNRGDRPQSMGEVGRALAACMAELGMTSGPTPLVTAAIPAKARPTENELPTRPEADAFDPETRLPTPVAAIQNSPLRVPSALEVPRSDLQAIAKSAAIATEPAAERPKQIVIGESAPGKANIDTDPVLAPPAPEPASKRGLWIGAALLALVVLVGVGMLLGHHTSPSPTQPPIVARPFPPDVVLPADIPPAPSPQPTKLAVATTPSPSPVVAKVALRKVTVRSVPSGAQVFGSEGGLLGPTPLDLELPPGQSRKVKVAANGYREAWKILEGSEREVSVHLEKLAAQTDPKPTAKSPSAPAPAPSPEGDPYGKVDDLKKDPYK